jgi:hypothetical protein
MNTIEKIYITVCFVIMFLGFGILAMMEGVR